MSRQGPLDLVIRRAQVTSAMTTSRREGRVEARVTWGWRGKARSRSEDRKKKRSEDRKSELFLFSLGVSVLRVKGNGPCSRRDLDGGRREWVPRRRQERAEHIG